MGVNISEFKRFEKTIINQSKNLAQLNNRINEIKTQYGDKDGQIGSLKTKNKHLEARLEGKVKEYFNSLFHVIANSDGCFDLTMKTLNGIRDTGNLKISVEMGYPSTMNISRPNAHVVFEHQDDAKKSFDISIFYELRDGCSGNSALMDFVALRKTLSETFSVELIPAARKS